MSQQLGEISALSEDIKEVLRGHSASTVMSAMTFVTAGVLASCEMKEGKNIDTALELFTTQARKMYVALTSEALSS